MKTIMLVVITLSGCAQYTYTKPVSLSEQGRDALYCDQYVMQSINSKGYNGNSAGMALEDIFARDRCMSSLGYRKVRSN